MRGRGGEERGREDRGRWREREGKQRYREAQSLVGIQKNYPMIPYEEKTSCRETVLSNPRCPASISLVLQVCVQHHRDLNFCCCTSSSKQPSPPSDELCLSAPAHDDRAHCLLASPHSRVTGHSPELPAAAHSHSALITSGFCVLGGATGHRLKG